MQYHGSLFGNIPGTRKYFDTGKTSKDWDRMEEQISKLRDAIERVEDAAYSAQDWGGTHLGAELENARRLLDQANIVHEPQAPQKTLKP